MKQHKINQSATIWRSESLPQSLGDVVPRASHFNSIVEDENCRKRGWFFVLVACVALVGCGESADAIKIRERFKKSQLASPPYVQNTERTPVRKWSGQSNAMVAPGVYGLGRLSPSSSYVIDTGEGLILIDTGVDELAVGLKEGLIEVGLKIDDVRYVLLTHAHYDHVFGSNRVREASGATVCAGADDVAVLESADASSLFSLFPRVDFTGTPIVVDRPLHDGDTIELGDTTINALACPGHTPGSMCYAMERAGVDILFSGDVIASFRFGPATYPIFISPRYRGDAGSFLTTITGLLARDAPDLLLPGHPRQQTFTRSLAMSPQQWREILQPARQEIELVLENQSQNGKDFLDGIPKRIEEGLFYLGDLDEVAIYGILAAGKFVVINAPGGNQFMEALKRQLGVLEIEFREPDAVLLTTNDEKFVSGLLDVSQATPVMSPGQSRFRRSDGVVMPSIDLASVKELLATKLEVIAIGDPDPFAFAYQMVINDRTILVTSSAPRNVGLDWVSRKTGVATQTFLEPQATDVRSLFRASETERLRYSLTLDAVEGFDPDVWLPSLPLTGQNANLYGDSWTRVMEANRDLARKTTKPQ